MRAKIDRGQVVGPPSAGPIRQSPSARSWMEFASRSDADQPVHFELNGRLEVGVHGEVRMDIEERPGPIRSVHNSSKEVRVLPTSTSPFLTALMPSKSKSKKFAV